MRLVFHCTRNPSLVGLLARADGLPALYMDPRLGIGRVTSYTTYSFCEMSAILLMMVSNQFDSRL